jgi:uncharacterized coiled-coil DUF342 family protein
MTEEREQLREHRRKIKNLRTRRIAKQAFIDRLRNKIDDLETELREDEEHARSIRNSR